jgi:FixJ family two-component response regulator
MPNMRGPELAKRLNDRGNGLRVIYMSGYLEFNNGSDFLEGMFFLQKPFSRDSLIAKIAEALGRECEVTAPALVHT